MTETNSNQHYKCQHCNCIFLTKADLQKHMSHFGDANERRRGDMLFELQRLCENKILLVHGFRNESKAEKYGERASLDFVGALRASFNEAANRRPYNVLVIAEEQITSPTGFYDNSPYYNFCHYYHVETGTSPFQLNSYNPKVAKPAQDEPRSSGTGKGEIAKPVAKATEDAKKALENLSPKVFESIREALQADEELFRQIKSLSDDVLEPTSTTTLLFPTKQELGGEEFAFRQELSHVLSNCFQGVYSGKQQTFYDIVTGDLPLLVELLDSIATRLEKEHEYTNVDIELVGRLSKSLESFKVSNAAVASSKNKQFVPQHSQEIRVIRNKLEDVYIRIVALLKKQIEKQIPSARTSATGTLTVREPLEQILALLPQEWHDSSLKITEFLSELSGLLQIENIIEQDKSTFIFSEKVTFDNGLGVLLPKLVKSGMKVAVVATNDRQRALIDQLNQGKPENERIIYADTVVDIRTKVHTARYYYFKVTGDPVTDLQGVTTFDITDIVKKIIDALGKVSGIIEREKLELLHQAAQKFVEAA